MDQLTVLIEEGTGDGVARWGAYEFWRIPRSFIPDAQTAPDQGQDALAVIFSSWLRGMFPPDWQWSQ